EFDSPLGLRLGIQDTAPHWPAPARPTPGTDGKPERYRAMVTAEAEVDLGQEAPEPGARRAWWPDAGIALALGVVSLLYRRQVPPDGLFFDDAWQALAATKGTLSQLFTVGQTQPGFGLELMMWSRLVGHSIVNMITPAIIAGTLGPPA